MSAVKLNNKQAAFVEEYLVDLNATAAAGRAGYSDPNYGRQLLTNPNVAPAIADAVKKRASKTEVTAERVLEELARIGFADIRDLFEWDEETAAFIPSRDITEAQAAAIASVKAVTTRHTRDDGRIETKIKLELKTHDKLGALREIGKHLGITERHTVDFKGGVLIVPAEGGIKEWSGTAREQQSELGRQVER